MIDVSGLKVGDVVEVRGCEHYTDSRFIGYICEVDIQENRLFIASKFRDGGGYYRISPVYLQYVASIKVLNPNQTQEES